MAKRRASIPRAVRDNVLAGFSHRCGICGADNPHLHHIDENPSNNDPHNLLPLCPNCHLNDQHNPTVRIEPERLLLFRKHKDPVILGSQFEPLFRRLRFLDDIADSADVKEFEGKLSELCEFIGALEMGAFYKRSIEKIARRPRYAYSVKLGGPDPKHQAALRRHAQEYRDQLRKVREQIYDLAVELLRYQSSWTSPG